MKFAKTHCSLSLCFAAAAVFSPLAQAQKAQNPPKQDSSPKAAKPMPGKRVVNRVAATVNGRVITTNELNYNLAPIYAQLSVQFPRRGSEFVRQMKLAKDVVLDELIDRELVMHEFASSQREIRDSFVNDEIEREINLRFDGKRDKFLETLKQAGMTQQSHREMVKRRMIVQAMRQEKYDQGLPPTPDEVQREYAKSKLDYRERAKDKIKFEKIFIALPSGPKFDAEAAEVQLKLAELIVEKIKGGEKFEDFAKKYSKDMHAENGGQWPEIERSELSPEFASVVFESAEGKLIGPLLDPFGFTIVRVKSKSLAPAPALEKIKPQIEEAVQRRKSAERYQKWIKRLRAEAMIDKRV